MVVWYKRRSNTAMVTVDVPSNVIKCIENTDYVVGRRV